MLYRITHRPRFQEQILPESEEILSKTFLRPNRSRTTIWVLVEVNIAASVIHAQSSYSVLSHNSALRSAYNSVEDAKIHAKVSRSTIKRNIIDSM
jgi:hypothetical protein